MRNFFYFTVLVALAACSDDRVTSPAASRQNIDNRLTPPTTSAAVNTPSQAKPVDQVGFTKITQVAGAYGWVLAGAMGEATALCPAGSTAVGGGFVFTGWATANPPMVSGSFQITEAEQTGWRVKVNNHLGAVPTSFSPYAICAS